MQGLEAHIQVRVIVEQDNDDGCGSSSSSNCRNNDNDNDKKSSLRECASPLGYVAVVAHLTKECVTGRCRTWLGSR